MEGLFAAVNAVLSFVTPVSDFFWDFPKMFGFWKAIPLLGQFSLAIIVLVGSGLYFTFRLGFIQIQCFSRGVRTLMDNHSIRTGISPLAAFCLSTAMRVGPGNIIGVTGAIAAGGPGALFWMWVSAFSVWRLLIRKVPWHRYSRRSGGKNLWEAFHSMRGVSVGTKCGSAWHYRWFISCMP